MLEANHSAEIMAQGAATLDATTMSVLEESAAIMAQGAATWDATMMSVLEMSAEIMAQGAATWNAAKMFTLDESAASITKQRNSMYLTNTIITLYSMDPPANQPSA